MPYIETDHENNMLIAAPSIEQYYAKPDAAQIAQQTSQELAHNRKELSKQLYVNDFRRQYAAAAPPSAIKSSSSDQVPDNSRL